MTNAIAAKLAEMNKPVEVEEDIELTPLEESNKKLTAVLRKRYDLTLKQARGMVGAIDGIFAEAKLPVVLK